MDPIVLGDGFIGTEIAKYLNCKTSKDMSVIKHYDTVINAVGRTGRPNVDWCEAHHNETIESNITFPFELVKECQKKGIYLIHIGSGCVYHSSPDLHLSEEEPPHFSKCSFYSKTKAISEEILSLYPYTLQLRIRMPIDGGSNPRNLLTKICSYKKVLDIQNSMTVIPDFLQVLDELIRRRRTGIYNVVNPGTISPYDIVKLYRELVDPSHEFEPLDHAEMNSITSANRSNCVLSTSKLESEGICLKPIQVRVREILSDPSFRKIT